MIGISQGSGKTNGAVLYLHKCVNCEKIIGETVSRGGYDEIVFYKDKTTRKKFNTFPNNPHYETLTICNFCNKPVDYIPVQRKDGRGIQWKYNNKSYLTDVKVNAD